MRPLRVLVWGADHAALAVSFADAGCVTVLAEPDPHDRARISAMLARRGGEGVTIADGSAFGDAPDVVLASGPLAPGLAEPGVQVVSLEWATGAQISLHLSGLPGRQPLLERMGPDPGGLVARLGEALGARVVGLPPGCVPPSQRLMATLSAEIERLALTGASPAEIDDALAAEGWAQGPFEAQDLAGIDTCLAARRTVLARHPGPPELPLFARAVAEGRLGRKVGVGWYRYPGGGGKVEDPLVEDMAMEEARFAALPRGEPDAEMICNRIGAVLRAEAARMVEDGVLTAGEIDSIAQQAIGTPSGLTL